MNHREDSVFARLSRPMAIGRVKVGSAWAKDVRVKKDSLSNTVGYRDSLLSITENPTKSGSCDTAGMSIVIMGEHRCSEVSSRLLESS